MLKYNVFYGVVFLVGSVIIFTCWLVWNIKFYRRSTAAIHLLNESLNSYAEGGSGLSESVFPVIVCENGGKILWVNESFNNISDQFPDFSGRNFKELLHLSGDIQDSIFQEHCNITGVSNKYSVYSYRISSDSFACFFIDDTDLKNTEAEFIRTRPVMLLITVDSLETTEDNLSHLEFTSVVSDVERIVSKWLASYKCAFRRYSEGKFIAVTESDQLDRMIADKFSVLDKTREINSNTDFEEITLTIGIGKDDGLLNSESACREALELAKGRGGDQVAMKINGVFSYFGGKTSIKERKGKVEFRLLCSQLDEYIESADNVFIMGHSFSDFDALGSAIGIASVCRAAGKPVKIFINPRNTLATPLLDYISSSSGAVEFVTDEGLGFEHFQNSLLIVTDTRRTDLADSKTLLEKCTRTVVIDHHRMQAENVIPAVFEIHDSHSSSACELVTEIVEYSKFRPRLTSAEATAILSGILLDTKNFSIRCGVRTFEAAAYLKDNNANTVKARKLFAGTAGQNIEISKILSHTEFFDRYALGRTEYDGSDVRVVCSKAADEMLNIKNVDASFVIYDTPNGVGISARSLELVNVQTIMERLGGGGHANMAACQIEGVTFDEAREMLINAINKNEA